MDQLSIISIMILIIVALFFGKILSYLTRLFFVALIVFFFLVLVFGISLDQLINWVLDILLVAI